MCMYSNSRCCLDILCDDINDQGFGEVLGAGTGQADGGDDVSVASAEPDEPGSPGRLSRVLEEPVSISTLTAGMAVSVKSFTRSPWHGGHRRGEGPRRAVCVLGGGDGQERGGEHGQGDPPVPGSPSAEESDSPLDLFGVPVASGAAGRVVQVA